MANGGDTSARSSDLYFVEEDEDGGEMREVTYGKRGSARNDHDSGSERNETLTKKSEDVHYLSFPDSKETQKAVVTRRRYTCLYQSVDPCLCLAHPEQSRLQAERRWPSE
jgi:hypothetical protein